MNIRELLKKTTLAAILCATMATSAWAQSVAWTTAKGAQSPIDFSTEQAVGALSTATTITATGTWSAAQVTNLQAALKSDGNIEADNSTLLTVDMSAAVWSDGVTAASLFRQCTALTSVILPEADNANSISFFCTFYYCESLKSITNLEKFTNVNYFYSTFYDCSSLESITLPAGTSYAGINFSCAFYGCRSLKSITNLEKFTNVSSFNTTFYDCSSLESITLSADTSYASINFALAFTNCTALTSVTNLEKFTNVSSFETTFEGCKALTSITLPAGTSDASISFSYTFDGCTALTSITNLEKFTNVNNFFRTFYGCTALESITLPEGTSYAPGINFSGTFLDCKSLKSITNLEKFTNVSSFDKVFCGCSSLESVTLPAGASDTSIGFAVAFDGCTALTSVTNLEKFTNVGSFDQTFEGCSSLESITLPAGTSNASISFYYTFDGCTALTSITNLEKFTNVNNFRYAFQNCSNLTSVELGVVPTNNIVDIFKGTDPNCLKYLPAGTTTVPTNWTNCIADGKALADITLTDEKPFHCPQAFSMDGHTMTYTRTWKYATKTGGWNTLYLPFAATATADNTPLTPATGGADGDYILKTLTGSTTGTLTMTSTGTVQAYTPYLVALPGNTFGDASLEGKTVTLVSATDAVIPATPEQTEQAGAYTMYGTLADYQADNLYLLTNEADGSSFDLYTDGGGVHAFRAYITANNANALKAPRLVIGDGGGVTGIRSASVGTKEVPAISHVYSIDGRLLRTVPAEEYAHRLDGLDRGIYIVNGVKEVVR